MSVKRLIKNLFYHTNTVRLLDRANYLFAKIKYLKKNQNFKKIYPEFSLPPDYYLYETYKLDYDQYKKDGEVTAIEILEWTMPYLQLPLKILEWGCGVARIIRHIPGKVHKDAVVSGVDINEKMIEWNLKNIPFVNFYKTNYQPPLPFPNDQFNLVYAFSVFTHIETEWQLKWIQEIHRIMQIGGVFLFSTHGKKYNFHLTENELNKLKNKGAVTKNYEKKGHRMMGTFNSYESFRKMIAPYFDVLEYYDGEEYPNKIGGQDLWIVKKK